MFCGQNLPDLEELYLGNNQLQKLDLNFECIEKLHFLDLSYNKIKRLSEKDLDRIGRNFDDTKKIDLTGNPYVCDCYLRPLFDWLSNKTTYLNRKNQMRCYTGTPAVNAGKSKKELSFTYYIFLNGFCFIFFKMTPRSKNHKCQGTTMSQ